MKDHQPITVAARACLSTLSECRRLHHGDVDEWPDWVQRRCVDFRMWCFSTGVFADGNQRLEEQLRLRGETGLVLSSFLHILHRSILALQEHLAGDEASTGRIGPASSKSASHGKAKADVRVAGSGSALPPGGSVPTRKSRRGICERDRAVMRDVERRLENLVRVSVAVGKSLPYTGLWQADSSFEASNDIQTPAPTNFGEPREIDDVPYRLRQANLKRIHRLKLGRERAWDSRTKSTEMPGIGWRHRSKRQRKMASEVAASVEEFDRKLALQVAKLGLPEIPSRSNSLEVHDKNRIPDLLPVSKEASEFACPICFHVLPASFAQPDAWRAHVAADFSTYTCVLPGCYQPLELYATRLEWEQHILNHPHRTAGPSCLPRWICPICPPAEQARTTFDDELWFADHLKTQHAKRPVHVRTLMHAGQQGPGQLRLCPVCKTEPACPDMSTALDHIAACLQDGVLESLRQFVQQPLVKVTAPPLEKSASTGHMQVAPSLPSLSDWKLWYDDVALALEPALVAGSIGELHFEADIKPWQSTQDLSRPSASLLSPPIESMALSRPVTGLPSRVRKGSGALRARNSTPERNVEQVISGKLWDYSSSRDASIVANHSTSSRSRSRHLELPTYLDQLGRGIMLSEWFRDIDPMQALLAGIPAPVIAAMLARRAENDASDTALSPISRSSRGM